ncbi:MAG TPA: hypothetical protein VMN36_14015 [Verrucomicrobiales bacterium]|nr:hypothetical protein [Verrucomicrobiales bacterium]
MNAFGYIVRRTFWQLGYKRQKRRWRAANTELQYLKQAEDLLGKIAWKDVEEVEELTGEYWQLKDIEKQQEQLQVRIDELERQNDELEDTYLDISEEIETQVEQIEERRAEVAEEVDALLLEVEDLREEAAQIRRHFDGLKVKYRVLKSEGGDPVQLEEVQERLRELQAQFNERKQLSQDRSLLIEGVEGRLSKIDEELEAKQKEFTERTSGISIQIGEVAKRLADCIARSGALERQKRELQSRVGLYLSANPNGSPALREATRKHADLIGKINYFRKSIQYNQRLAKGV